MCHLRWLHVAGNLRFPATWSVLSWVPELQEPTPVITSEQRYMAALADGVQAALCSDATAPVSFGAFLESSCHVRLCGLWAECHR